MVVSSDGLVLTAAHVSGPRARNVTFRFPDGKTARGKTLERDEDSDVSFLRITDAGPWPYLPLGELESAKPGDWVIALGHPGGFDAKRSLVVRSGRIIRIRDLVQTDCTISPGDSGGPLVDMHGRVIGIHTTIGGMTENYHVPITGFYDIWRQVAAPEERRASAPDKGQTSDAFEAAH